MQPARTGSRPALLALPLGALLLAATAVRPAAAVQRAGAGAPQPGRDDGTFVQERGVLGTIHPQTADVILPDTVVHQDTYGGARQVLQDLAGSPDGFAAVWQDDRDGNLGLYVGLLDLAGEPVRAEQPIHPPRSSRQLEPAIALARGCAGAVAWFYFAHEDQQVHLRFFRGAEGVIGEPVPVGASTGWGERASGPGWAIGERFDAGGREGGGRPPAGRDTSRASHVPSIAMRADGGGLLGWVESGRVRLLAFEGDWRRPEADPVDASAGGADADAARDVLRVAVGEDGGAFAAWATQTGTATWTRAADGAVSRGTAGAGRPVRAVSDDEGGFWIMIANDGALRLVRLGADGVPRADVELEGRYAAADLARWSGGLALVTEEAASGAGARGGRGGAPAGNGVAELRFLDGEARPSKREPLALPTGAAGPHVAAGGPDAGALLVAWTDSRDGNPDVRYRLVRAEGAGEDRRWNSDEASSNQVRGDVAGAGWLAAVVWEDHRDGAPHVFARVLDASGTFHTDELRVGLPPAERPDTEAQRAHAALPAGTQPTVAVHADGTFLVVWKEAWRDGVRTRGQLFRPDGSATTAPFDVDPGQAGAPGWTAAAIPVPAAAGRSGSKDFLVFWVRDGVGLFGRRISARGEPGELHAVSGIRAVFARNPAAALLDDGQVAVAWDIKSGRVSQLRGRTVDLEGKPGPGPDFFFQPSPGGGDWDPELAPARGGGFLLVWTGNEGVARDVLARRFDERARPLGPMLSVSPKLNEQDYPDVLRLGDGSFVVAWEDDISYRDQTHVRRIDPAGRVMGPPRTLNQRRTKFAEHRSAPRIARLGDGFVGVWGDRRRALGQDVFLRVVGPRFDEGAEEAER